jgi:hypothetical protein
MRIFVWGIAFFFLFVIAYFIWASGGRNYQSFTSSGTFTGEILSEGEESARGNFVGIQPYLVASDYCSELHFMNALRPYFESARSGGFLGPNTIVILPENSGTWLVAHHEKTSVYLADSLMHATSAIVNSNIFKFISNIPFAKADDKIRHSLFLMKAPAMARVYESVFSSLAREYKVTLVAGSIVLPNPIITEEGRLKTTKGLLYNASFVFGPDGKFITQPLRKLKPGIEEKRFVSAANSSHSSVIKTPGATISLLFSADSVKNQQPQKGKVAGNIIYMSSLENDTGLFDPGKHNEKTRLQKNLPRNSMYVPYSGKLWEKQYRGNIVITQGDSVKVFEPVISKGRIINLWLK